MNKALQDPTARVNLAPADRKQLDLRIR